MEKRALGKTGIEVSSISLGTWGLSGGYGPVTDQLFRDTLKAAREAEISTIDVAPLWGKTEEVVGEYFDGACDEVEFITRAGVVEVDDEVQSRFDVESLRKDCEQSLKRLRTERIDVWLLHHPTEEDLRKDELYELTEDLKKEGKIRAWGISARSPAHARIALKRDCEVLCLRHNLLRRDELTDLNAEIERTGCGVLVCSPLHHGLLTGRWTEYRQFPPTDHRKGRWTSRSLGIRVRQVNKLRFLIRDGVPNMTAASLRYALHSKNVSSVLLGARRPVQITNLQHHLGDALPAGDVKRVADVLAG